MVQRIRELLLTQYIGAMVIALVAAQGFIHLIAIVTGPLNVYLLNYAQQLRGGSSVFTPPPRIDWHLSIGFAVNAVLSFGVAYLLLRWLYLRPAEPPGEETPKQQASE